jgi:hypothetical protein
MQNIAQPMVHNKPNLTGIKCQVAEGGSTLLIMIESKSNKRMSKFRFFNLLRMDISARSWHGRRAAQRRIHAGAGVCPSRRGRCAGHAA